MRAEFVFRVFLLFGWPQDAAVTSTNIKKHTYFIQRRCVTIAANNTKDTLVNEAIDFPEVRVIGADGEQLGLMSSEKALKMA